MSPVYRVNKLTKGNHITDIYVFAGLQEERAKELTSNIRSYDSPAAKESALEFFDDAEFDYIVNNNVNVEILPMAIYLDDSIDIVKRKLLLSTDADFPFEAMYLFSKVKKRLSPVTVYQNLTQNGRVELTSLRLHQFLMNIGYGGSVAEKEVYTYDDVIGLGLEQREWNVSVPIGQHFVAVEGTYPYNVNPYNVKKFDPLLVNSVSNMVSTTNSQLLLDSGSEIADNDIFLCLAADVLEYSANNGLSEGTTIRIYYPFLSSNNILTFDEYNNELGSLVKDSKAMIQQSFVKQIESVELLYNVYESRESSKYAATYEGVDSVEFIMHPQYSFNLPLDIVFKVLHADENVPMLKLNPGKGQEKLYRLYANRTSSDGRLVPFLSKNEALKNAKLIAKKNRVSAFIQPQSSGNTFLCEFADNGDVTIKVSCNQIVTVQAVEEMIRENVNPVIRTVADFLAQSGYQFDLFDKISSERIEMLDVTYKLGFPIKKTLGLSKKQGCIAPVFNIVSESATSKTEPIKMQYKRVSDFSEMESQEAFMLNLMKRGTEEEELIASAMANFGLTEAQVRERLAAMLSGLQVVHNAFQNKRFRIKNNPGFPVVITRNVSTNAYDVVVSDITGAQYIPHIKAFVDSVVRISQEPDSTAVSKSKITSACRGKSQEDVKAVVIDIVATPEKPVGEYEGMEIEAEQIDFRDDVEQDDYLDMLLGVDDEDDEDEDDNQGEYDSEEYSNDDRDEQSGGAKKKTPPASPKKDASGESEVIDVAGMNLGHPNPFFKRMQERDPALFVTRKEGKFKAYSKICQWNQRRQPVVLTQEEKDKIDKKHPGSYKHAVKYGTDPENPLWYICPRYWSLSRNTSLTEEQVKSGKYGKVISNPNAKVVPEGEDIFEFGHYDADGNYQDYYPGFIDPESHQDGFCLPCCFKTWGGPKQTHLREQCERQGAKAAVGKATEEPTKGKPKGRAKKSDVVGRVETDDYIMGADKFPLVQGRWGFLVPVLQMFFQYDSKKCIVSPTKPTLRLDTPCLLRRGVESSKNQSFVAAISDAYAEENKNIVLTVTAMKQKIMGAVNLTNFRLFQNGNLVDLFYDAAKPSRTLGEIGAEYGNEPVVSELADQKDGVKLLSKLANAYENFLAYLQDDDVVIDYTYLWDIVCTPNPKLFKNGMNLVILEAPNDDITGNVQLVCPTNQYVKDPFDFNRGSLILFKSGNYYEPLYVIKDTGKQVGISRFFSLKSHSLLAPIKSVLMTAKSATNEMCVPLASMPTVYSFRSNLPIAEIHRKLTLRDIVIKEQIINYSGQAIALIAVNKAGTTGYIPTQASSPLSNLPQLLLDSFSDYSDYQTTVDFLASIVKATKGAVPCDPKLRLEEDGLTVGILTETNQLVPLSAPELVTDSSLPAVDENMSVARDVVSETGDGVDSERVEYVNRIKLETEFYNSFRNTVRILLSKYDNRELRKAIETAIRSPFLTYGQKLAEVSKLLRNLADSSISWDSNFDIASFVSELAGDGSDKSLNRPSSCVLFKKDKCSTMPLCRVANNDVCLTVLPAVNVLTGADSEQQYYIKMADELVRYNRIRTFVFKPQTFLSFGKVGYDLRDDEVLVLQTMMTSEYFDSLETSLQDAPTYNNTFQTAQPTEAVKYDSAYIETQKGDAGQKDEPKQEDADMEVVKLYGKWKAFFSVGTSEVKFGNTVPSQTFQPIMLLMKRLKPSLGDLTLTEVKDMLSSLYEEVFSTELQVTSIWENEGKKKFAKMLSQKEASLDAIVMSESYYATTVDFILLANKVGIPLVFYSSTKLSANGKAMLKTSSAKEVSFVKVPSLDMPDLPSYRIIVGKEGLQIPLLSLDNTSRDEINALPVFDVANYLKPSVIKVKKRVAKKTNMPQSITEVVVPASKPKKTVAKRKPRLKIVA